MPKLNKRFIDALKPEDRDIDYFDEALAGFGLRVRKSGRKVYFVRQRFKGSQRRVTIGYHGAWTAETARTEAKRILGELATGQDPTEDVRKQKSAITVKALGERFLSEYADIHLKATTQREYRRSVEIFITPIIGKQVVHEIERRSIAELHHGLRHIPYQANRTLGVLSKMFSMAEVWGLRADNSNPCVRIKKYREEKRERFLSPTELRRLGRVLDQAEAECPSAVVAYRLLLLTGCRLGEIQTLQWKFIDFEQKQIRLPESKTGEKVIYLTDETIAVLNSVPKLCGNAYVVVGATFGGYLTDLQKPWRRIRKLAGIDDVRIHDLRHTYASQALALGQTLPLIGKLLGHTQVQTTARYAHLAADPVRRAAAEVANHVKSALNGNAIGDAL